MSDPSQKIIPLFGLLPEQVVTPDCNVIAELERLLEAARAGEIIGLVGAYLHKNGSASYSFAGVISRFAVIGGLECAKERVMRLTQARD